MADRRPLAHLHVLFIGRMCGEGLGSAGVKERHRGTKQTKREINSTCRWGAADRYICVVCLQKKT